MVDYVNTADNLSRAVSVLLLFQATSALFRPLQGVLRFGIPTTSEDRALFYPVVGGRNATLGLSMLTLSLQGHRKAVGTILACSMAAGAVDTWVCMNHRGRWTNHAVGSAVLAGLGWILLA